MNVKYVGPAKDYSGYGEACRHDIAALVESGVNVTTKVPKYTPELADFGRLGEIIDPLFEKPIDYNVIILHTTPNVYRQYMEQGKYHIARVFWETDKLPQDFSQNIQMCDEVWTGSEFNKQAIINSGVTKPIYIIPEAVDTTLDTSKIRPYTTANQSDYKFYSIFEWTERKNPAALLEAYWREFENDEKVSLSIKTYLDNFSKEKKEEIDRYIRKLKARLNLKRYAPVYLYRNLMDRGQVYRFHKTFDCFVSAHRGEGWGIPQMEAMLMGNPIIATDCGGIHEYLKGRNGEMIGDDGPDALLVRYDLVPLSGNSRNQQWYEQDQKWAQIDIKQLQQAMRMVFDNQDKARGIGVQGQKTVNRLFALKTVGDIMKDRLTKIGV